MTNPVDQLAALASERLSSQAPMKNHLETFIINGPLDAEEIESIASSLGTSLRPDYLDFMQRANGGDGFIGETYMILWRMEELSDFNREYEVAECAQGLFLFGSDGGGEAFAFDTRFPELPIVMVPFIGMSLEDARPIADSFAEFIHIAANGSLF